MPNPQGKKSNYTLAKLILTMIISLSLFLGGILLLALRISGWSIFLGLPATQVGIIFLIFTVDDLARKKVGPESLCVVKCSNCGVPTVTPCGQKKDICEECQKKLTTSRPGALRHSSRL